MKMRSCKLPKELIEQAKTFHGHWCPGLAIGIRMAEAALKTVGHNKDEEILCISECDNCAVDAVQFLTGCTIGKGNLKIENIGKTTFRFYRRSDRMAVRISRLNKPKRAEDPREKELRDKYVSGTLSEEEMALYASLRKEKSDQILKADLAELVKIQEIPYETFPRALMTDSVTCAQCGESTMETMAKLLRGKPLCIPCFEKIVKEATS